MGLESPLFNNLSDCLRDKETRWPGTDRSAARSGSGWHSCRRPIPASDHTPHQDRIRICKKNLQRGLVAMLVSGHTLAIFTDSLETHGMPLPSLQFWSSPLAPHINSSEGMWTSNPAPESCNNALNYLPDLHSLRDDRAGDTRLRSR